MSDAAADPVRESLEACIGKPFGSSGPALAPEPVNLPMMRHWVDAIDDRNPVYDDPEIAARTRFGGVVAPPAMLQTWSMPRPLIEGIAERGGSPVEIDPDSPLITLDKAGFVGTLATNSELEFVRYLRPGDRIVTSIVMESISEKKGTALGVGYFVTWATTYTVDGETVGRQLFRIFKFQPGATLPEGSKSKGSSRPKPKSEPLTGEELPPFDLELTPTMVVAGAIASRDFMPVHHDPEYARSQHAPDIFFNILTTNGYVSRYITDWAGPEAMLRSIRIKLGAPAVPHKTLRFRGQVAREAQEGGERVLEVAVNVSNDLGPHATGTVELSLPLAGDGA